ncbi:MAG: hypothetical protein E7597_00890 [Ruminococcaceae bacterium]|nr:hypothetical protein [Oscillospiraceae bacterium]
MSEQMYEQKLNEKEDQMLDKMSRALREIWKIIVFCCIGWLLVCIGMKTNPLFALVGALVISVPSVICVRRHGIKNIFNYDYVIETTYRSGRKTYDVDLGGKLGLMVIQLFATIFIGVVLTPIRYVVYCLKFNSNCKQLNFKPEFKLGVLFPTVVGVSTFIVGIVLGSIL